MIKMRERESETERERERSIYIYMQSFILMIKKRLLLFSYLLNILTTTSVKSQNQSSVGGL